MITQDILKHHVTYDPDTGKFYSNGIRFSSRKKGEEVGTIHKTKGYMYLVIKNKTYRAQRLAFLYMTGNWPVHQIDHINQDKTDNRWCNLRDVTPAINCQNRKLFSTNTSGYKGVVWQKHCNKWQVLCRANGKQHYLGLYENKEEAIKVAKEFYDNV